MDAQVDGTSAVEQTLRAESFHSRASAIRKGIRKLLGVAPTPDAYVTDQFNAIAEIDHIISVAKEAKEHVLQMTAEALLEADLKKGENDSYAWEVFKRTKAPKWDQREFVRICAYEIGFGIPDFVAMLEASWKPAVTRLEGRIPDVLLDKVKRLRTVEPADGYNIRFQAKLG